MMLQHFYFLIMWVCVTGDMNYSPKLFSCAVVSSGSSCYAYGIISLCLQNEFVSYLIYVFGGIWEKKEFDTRNKGRIICHINQKVGQEKFSP